MGIPPAKADSGANTKSAIADDEIIPIELLVGLPPAHYSALYGSFEKFFMRQKVEEILFNGNLYEIYINKAIAYPQAFAAAQTILPEIEEYPKAYVIDIGGFTADYLLLKYGDTDLDEYDSLDAGVIRLYNKISSRIRADSDLIIDDVDIDAILQGATSQYDEGIKDIVLSFATDFINDLVRRLRELDIDLRSSKAIFVGGGSLLLKEQILASAQVWDPIILENIAANAIGYELVYASQMGG